jgi:DNA-binding MarR family transcriptional regulator
MSPSNAEPAKRTERLEHVSSQLLARVALLTRLLTRHLLGDELSRSEAGVLNTLRLRGGPRRITELAEIEGLAQPTMTLLVQRLEQRGFVARERLAGDGRVVLVSLTDAGHAAIGHVVERATDALSASLAEMADEQVQALAAATDTLGQLVALLQKGVATDAIAGSGTA